MSDMKCPICGKQMKIGTLDFDDSMATVWMSIIPRNCVCDYGASKAVWQELIRTRKALGIAVNALKLFCGEDVSYYSQSKIDARDARTALDKITTLEQKE